MNSQETKPVAWSYDLAEWPEGDLHSRGWRPNLSWQLPGFPTMIRNVTPLCRCSQPHEPLTDEQTKALQDVIAERKRQIAVEGWTPEHDDEHAGGDLAEAAACYVLGTADKDTWPWEWEAWKPKDGRSNLVRAAALLLAEIERLDRAHNIRSEG